LVYSSTLILASPGGNLVKQISSFWKNALLIKYPSWIAKIMEKLCLNRLKNVGRISSYGLGEV